MRDGREPRPDQIPSQSGADPLHFVGLPRVGPASADGVVKDADQLDQVLALLRPVRTTARVNIQQFHREADASPPDQDVRVVKYAMGAHS